jgi:TRAP-type C4-dicarboxylate transport system permease small subunit
LLRTITKRIQQVSAGLNGVSAAAIALIMLLTCADVVLRLFGRPVPGTYELVGYFGAVIVAAAMAWTSVERGHISVEMLVDRLPRRARHVVEALGAAAGAVLFSLLAWQCRIYAADLMETGEVSPTLGVATWPFVGCISLGSALLALVLLVDALRDFRKGLQP